MKTNGNAPENIDPRALMRLRQVLALIPIGRTAWWDGVRSGKYPKPIKLGPRTTCWRARDIFDLLEGLSNQG